LGEIGPGITRKRRQKGATIADLVPKGAIFDLKGEAPSRKSRKVKRKARRTREISLGGRVLYTPISSAVETSRSLGPMTSQTQEKTSSRKKLRERDRGKELSAGRNRVYPGTKEGGEGEKLNPPETGGCSRLRKEVTTGRKGRERWVTS